MVFVEPDGLAKIRALARHLEMKPLLELILFRLRFVGDLLRGIVFLNQVLDNGARFPDGDSSVGVFNGWNTRQRGFREISNNSSSWGKKIFIPAIRVDADIRLLLDEFNEFVLIRKAELLQDDGHLYSRSVVYFSLVNINSVPSMDWGRSGASRG